MKISKTLLFLSVLTLNATSFAQANNCSFGNTDCQVYQSSSGTKYQYDMSNPSDRLNYSIDLDAQMRDKQSIDINRNLDTGIGQYGGGIYQ